MIFIDTERKAVYNTTISRCPGVNIKCTTRKRPLGSNRFVARTETLLGLRHRPPLRFTALVKY